MTETAKLLRLFRVDKQLRGLEGRLKVAERFLSEQDRLLEEAKTKKQSIEAQLRQLNATVANREGEAQQLEARIETLREQMNEAKTNREYKAFLTEINTLKAEKSRIDDEALELMAKVDELNTQVGEYARQAEEREGMRRHAQEDRDRRAEEIRERVEELRKQRDTLAQQVPAEAMRTYNARMDTALDDDEVMAPVEEQNRKRHEYTCGSCMMTIPIESVSSLLSHGSVTCCVSCGVILYVEEELAQSMTPSSAKS